MNSSIRFALRAAVIGAAVLTSILPVNAAGRNKLLLSVVPADAATVGVVRLDEMRDLAIARRLFLETDKAAIDGEAQQFLRDAGLKPSEDVDAFIFAASPAADGEGEVLVAAEGRFDPAKLSAALVARGGSAKSAAGRAYLILPEQGDQDDRKGAVAFYDRNLTLAGTEKAVVQALSTLGAGGSRFAASSGLAFELGRIDQDASCWLLIDVPRSGRMAGNPAAQQTSTGNVSADALQGALKKVSVFAAWADATNDNLTFRASAVSSDDETRELLADMLRGLTAGWRMAAQEKKPELVSVIRKFVVDDEKGAVTVSGTIPMAMLEDFSKRTPATVTTK